jgi:hypothetical protein
MKKFKEILNEKDPVGPSGTAQEIQIWADSLKWAAEQTNLGNYERQADYNGQKAAKSHRQTEFESIQ